MVLGPADVLPPGHVLFPALVNFEAVEPNNPSLPMRDLRGKWGLLSAILPMRPRVGLETHRNRAVHWLCVCTCGTWTLKSSDKLVMGRSVSCTIPCFKRAVATFAESNGVSQYRARIALLAPTRSPVQSASRERALLGKQAPWRTPDPSDAGVKTSGSAIVAAIESAWSITGVLGECTVHVHGRPRPAHARETTSYGFHLRWYWYASVARTSDGKTFEGVLRHTIHGALESLLTALQKDREVR